MLKSALLFLKNMFSALILFFYDGGKKPNLEVIEKPISTELVIQHKLDKKSEQMKSALEIIGPEPKKKVDLFGKFNAHLVYKVTSFLDKGDFVNLAATNKKIRSSLENTLSSFNFIQHLKNSKEFYWFDLVVQGFLSYQFLPEILSRAEKSGILAQMVKISSGMYLHLSSNAVQWLNRVCPQWVEGVKKLQIPIVLQDLSVLNCPPLILSNVVAVQILPEGMNFADPAAFSLIRDFYLKHRPMIQALPSQEELPALKEFLNAGLVATMRLNYNEFRLLINNEDRLPETNLSSLRLLSLIINNMDQTIEMLSCLPDKVSNLQLLIIHLPDLQLINIQTGILRPLLLRKLEGVMIYGLESLSNPAFKDFCKVLPDNLQMLNLHDIKITKSELNSIVQHFKNIYNLELVPHSDHEPLAEWVQKLAGYKNLKSLDLYLKPEYLRSKKQIDEDRASVSLPFLFPYFEHLSFSISMGAALASAEHWEAIGDEIISILPAFDIEKIQQDTERTHTSKVLEIENDELENVDAEDVYIENASLLLLRLLRASGSHVKLHAPARCVHFLKRHGFLHADLERRVYMCGKD